MRVERLRPLPTPEQLAAMYATPHDHRLYGRGHDERVEATIALALHHIDQDDRLIVGDLSCGNGEIARRICTGAPAGLQLGDFAAGYEYQGPIEQTIEDLPLVDVFVLSETIEHLDDPLDVLLAIRRKTKYLLLSTPLECWNDSNGEHVWAWDREGVEQLAASAGFADDAFTSVDSREYGEPYLYGIWVAS